MLHKRVNRVCLLLALPELASIYAYQSSGLLYRPVAICQPVRPPKKKHSSKKLHQFHVCPLLFREKMGPDGEIGGGNGGRRDALPNQLRPVYRYIFSCPGQAQALVSLLVVSPAPFPAYGNEPIARR